MLEVLFSLTACISLENITVAVHQQVTNQHDISVFDAVVGMSSIRKSECLDSLIGESMSFESALREMKVKTFKESHRNTRRMDAFASLQQFTGFSDPVGAFTFYTFDHLVRILIVSLVTVGSYGSIQRAGLEVNANLWARMIEVFLLVTTVGLVPEEIKEDGLVSFS